MAEKPTFEDLVGDTEAQEWANDVSDGELSIVSALANKQLELAAQVAQLEADLKAKKEELRLTSEQELPDAMKQVGLTEITLSRGEKISVKEFYNANGHAGLIKNDILLKFDRGEDEKVEQTVSALQARGLTPQVRQSVHHSSLKAFVKEQFTAGNDIPTEPFGIYIGAKAIIKKD